MHFIIKLLAGTLVLAVILMMVVLIPFLTSPKGTQLKGFTNVTGEKYAIIATGSDHGISLLSSIGSGGTRFTHEGNNIMETLKSDYGYDPSHVFLFAEDKAGFLAKMQQLSSQLKAGDQLSVIFLAHGGTLVNSTDFAIILDQPLRAGEMQTAIDRFQNIRTFVFLSSCASGGFVPYLSKVNRVVFTTGVGSEMNTNLPSLAFAEGLARKIADQNKDGKVSVTEIFHFIKREVAADYQRITGAIRPDSDLVQVDDNADRVGSIENLPHGSEGYVADITYI